MSFAQDKTVLLFYKDFERDSLFPGDRHLKRAIRPVYHLFSKGQKVSGFSVWYQLLVRALRQQGYDVRCNDYRAARRHPSHPVGLVGYPHVLDGWDLPNPAILGPGLYDHPSLAPDLMRDPRFRAYIVTCDWMRAMFLPFYGQTCADWHAGIELDKWEDTRPLPKTTDILIYDKIRWNRDHYEPHLIQPIQDELHRRGLSYKNIRYKAYDHATYRAMLRESRAMLFLCEHETQGMAYQEAMAANVPVLAWENGFWLDPRRPEFDPQPVPATSVPYFSPECGERFRDGDDFAATLDTFWERLAGYRPREYVARELSLAGSARQYMDLYAQIAAQPATAEPMRARG